MGGRSSSSWSGPSPPLATMENPSLARRRAESGWLCEIELVVVEEAMVSKESCARTWCYGLQNHGKAGMLVLRGRIWRVGRQRAGSSSFFNIDIIVVHLAIVLWRFSVEWRGSTIVPSLWDKNIIHFDRTRNLIN